MRVDSIDLYSNDTRIATFNVRSRDYTNPYMIRAITGLDADSIIPRFYGLSVDESINFYDLTLEPREIAMRIALNPNVSIGATITQFRDALYKAIASNRSGKIQLRFNEGNVVVAAISGFVTRFEAPLFQQQTDVQITMRCDDPIFRSMTITSVIEDTLSTEEPLLIDPVSTCPHGFRFSMTLLDDVSGIIIQDAPAAGAPTWRFEIDFEFLTDDQLFFSSEFGEKYLYILRGVSTQHLMNDVVSGSVWPILFPGENQLYLLDGASALIDTKVEWDEVFWYETHWGV